MKKVFGLLCVIIITFFPACSTSKPVQKKEIRGKNNTVAVIPEKEAAPAAVEEKPVEPAEPVPAAEKKPEEPQKVEPVKPQVALTTWQLNRAVLAQGRADFYPVHKDGNAVALYHDIDGNGLDDPVAVFVSTDDFFQADISKLSDFSRVYNPDAEPFTCWLVVFYQDNGSLKEGLKVKLGKRVVLDGLSELKLSKNPDIPYSVSVNFQSSEGAVNEWMFFQSGKVEQFTVKETLAVHPEVVDIDNDGILDVLFFEKSFEEGTGYETFISWYKWNGKTFTEHSVTNIVRNLKAFFKKSRSYMISGFWDEFFRFALDDRQYASIKDKKLTQDQLLSRLFMYPSSDEEKSKGVPSISQLHIQDVIFPEIFENPFQKTNLHNYIFPLRVRVIAEEGEYLFVSRILMLKNPFQKRQFSFIMTHEYVHY